MQGTNCAHHHRVSSPGGVPKTVQILKILGDALQDKSIFSGLRFLHFWRHQGLTFFKGFLLLPASTWPWVQGTLQEAPDDGTPRFFREPFPSSSDPLLHTGGLRATEEQSTNLAFSRSSLPSSFQCVLFCSEKLLGFGIKRVKNPDPRKASPRNRGIVLIAALPFATHSQEVPGFVPNNA